MQQAPGASNFSASFAGLGDLCAPYRKLPVDRLHASDLLNHLLAQTFRLKHLDMVAVAQDIHDEFCRIVVGHSQHIAAVFMPLGNLVRMPLLLADPAGTLGIEA